MNNTRLIAARCCLQIIDKGRSLDRVLSELTQSDDKTQLSPADRSFVKELVFGVCRWHGHLEHLSTQLLSKPLRTKDRDIHYLLLVGLYQLQHISTADHAAVAETVNGAKKAKKVWAVKLLNACLRRFQRDDADKTLDVNSQDLHQLTHPQWLVKRLKADWPDHWPAVLQANDERPAMCLRVNTTRVSRADYLQRLNAFEIDAIADPMSEAGIILETAKPVTALPGFENGDCSVQDTAAQLAVQLLAPAPHQRILDACSAPGGKLAHILELTQGLAIVDAMDIESTRVESIKDTLERLQLTANVASADASDSSTWPFADGQYDKILIDAPCSGTGVIRRHPDIRHHRRVQDIEALQPLQAAIMNACWDALKPGGQLLYATCSVLNAENEQQASAFLQRHKTAAAVRLEHPCAFALEIGVQTLPGVHPMDGFYYAMFEKSH
ncbi:MAG: 16S rRNA (cytosine(967)-C(5))-methyltransferase RsmB [Arenicella sp.]|jgi:16S rRNA (cytosine967-C5)-methyltransferase|nr:16S rRNA (cytosine(967)-C(5))-methyltransferase RsmB [Arenicella sp.]